MRPSNAKGRPTIYVSVADHDRLAPVARSLDCAAGELLKEELARATILHGEAQPGYAHLNSVVTYLDRATGRTQTVDLVPADAAECGPGCVSILTPLGAALLGLAEGAEFKWRSPAGYRLDLKIFGVGRRDESCPDGVRYYHPPSFDSLEA